MLNVEELVDYLITEEGQTLLGLDFLVSVLNLSMKRLENMFVKSVKEYQRRRPLTVTEVRYGNSFGIIQMPEDTMSVKSTRYGVLPEFPRFFQDEFGYQSFEYDKVTQQLKVYPPVTPIKVTYTKGYTITNSSTISGSIEVSPDETYIMDILPTTYKKGSINITLGNYSLKEVGREVVDVNIEGAIVQQEVSNLEGTLGTGTFNLTTKELEIEVGEDVEINEPMSLEYTYTPTYKTVLELDIGDYVFTKLFCSKFLEAVASARAQATQANVHSIDLTEDQLYVRARILKKEVRELLASTIDFGAMADI